MKVLRPELLWILMLVPMLAFGALLTQAAPERQSIDDFPMVWQQEPEVRLDPSIMGNDRAFVPDSIVKLDDGRCRMYFTVLEGYPFNFVPPGVADSDTPAGVDSDAPPGADDGTGSAPSGLDTTPPPENSQGPDFVFQFDGEGECGEYSEPVAFDPSMLPTAPPTPEGEPGGDGPPGAGEGDGPPGAGEGDGPPAAGEGDGPPGAGEGGEGAGDGPPILDAEATEAAPVPEATAEPTEEVPPFVTDSPDPNATPVDGPPLDDDSGPPIGQQTPEIRVSGIGTAVSVDGLNWLFEPGLVLEASQEDGTGYFDTRAAAVTRLEDGRWRLYFEARRTPQAPVQIFSALSPDGRNFTIEDEARIEVLPGETLLDARHPAVWYDAPTEQYWMLFGARVLLTPEETPDADPQEMQTIALASSPDGLDWTVVDPQLFVDALNPSILLYPDDMLVAIWSGLDGQLLTSIPLGPDVWFEGTPLTLQAPDGSPVETLLSPEGDPLFSPVAPLLTVNGELRLFYEQNQRVYSLAPAPAE